jgi:ADP-ribosylarginine hydrolase
LSSLDHCKKQAKKGLTANKWEEVCLRGMLHGGDSDSTGTIAAAWYGALYGFDEVYPSSYEHSEGKELIEGLGVQIFERAYG